jgi:hypothetical protein
MLVIGGVLFMSNTSYIEGARGRRVNMARSNNKPSAKFMKLMQICKKDKGKCEEIINTIPQL